MEELGIYVLLLFSWLFGLDCNGKWVYDQDSGVVACVEVATPRLRR